MAVTRTRQPARPPEAPSGAAPRCPPAQRCCVGGIRPGPRGLFDLADCQLYACLARHPARRHLGLRAKHGAGRRRGRPQKGSHRGTARQQPRRRWGAVDGAGQSPLRGMFPVPRTKNNAEMRKCGNAEMVSPYRQRAQFVPPLAVWMLRLGSTRGAARGRLSGGGVELHSSVRRAGSSPAMAQGGKGVEAYPYGASTLTPGAAAGTQHAAEKAAGYGPGPRGGERAWPPPPPSTQPPSHAPRPSCSPHSHDHGQSNRAAGG
jgi:hypothetical protein